MNIKSKTKLINILFLLINLFSPLMVFDFKIANINMNISMNVYAASAVDTIDSDDDANEDSKNSKSIDSADSSDSSDSSLSSDNLFNEKIVKIGSSQKIFIITNDNKDITPGDYITIIRNDQLIARALVAKVKENQAGIKITKIYSIANWNTLKANSNIKILKGDDTYYLNEKKRKADAIKAASSKQPIDETKDDFNSEVLSEKDLLSDNSTDDSDEASEEKGKRSLKTDNMIAGGYGLLPATGADGATKRYAHWNLEWAYQLRDNFWAEALYGQSTMKSFPATDLDTKAQNMIFRLKYSFAVPFYSYVLPYLGYQIVKASCEGAGEKRGGDDALVGDKKKNRDDERNAEPDLVNNIEKKSIVYGVTLLKRLVPGWFVRADVGTDLLNIGFSFEF
ncbi:MAG: hypothetical protein HQK51_02360 [Oligoflexia bacterium]|nr:hypothetical protein [Oligoflexia bacterium]